MGITLLVVTGKSGEIVGICQAPPSSGVEAGLLRSLRTPGQTLPQPRDSVVYNGLGNLFKTKTPLGFWTIAYSDTAGRDTLVVTPTDTAQTSGREQRVRTVYDASDRDTLTVSIGPSLPYRRTAAGDSSWNSMRCLFSSITESW